MEGVISIISGFITMNFIYAAQDLPFVKVMPYQHQCNDFEMVYDVISSSQHHITHKYSTTDLYPIAQED